VFLTDLHYGYERRGGHKVPLHDPKALSIAVQFAQDFKPDVLILGGDILDCGAISHHNKHKPGRVEGLRLSEDAAGCAQDIIEPLSQLAEKRYYIIGNHEGWLSDITDEVPGLGGFVSIERVLPLQGWSIVSQGDYVNLGKITFIHGDQLSGGEYVAKSAVLSYERSIRFGHFHTYQAYTKTSAIGIKYGRTGIAIPCLCAKGPGYGKGAPNRWVQGFNFGYLDSKGYYTDFIPIIVNKKSMIEGKTYKG